MRFKQLGYGALALGMALTAAPVLSAQIMGLENTGIDVLENSGAGDGLDDNWTLWVQAGSASLMSAYPSAGAHPYATDTSDNGSFPLPPWLANTATSSWLTPAQDPGTTFDASANGVYVYSLSFDLTGYDPAQTSFTVNWATDNNSSMYLNGNLLASPINAGSNEYTSWRTVNVSSNFNYGANNTLAFVVNNLQQSGGNPTGFRAEFSNVSVSPIPEPHEWAMMLSGLSMIGVIAARRRKSAGA